MPDRDVTAGAVLMAELEMLKDEQRSRLSTRDNLIYATLVAAAAIVAAMLRTDGPPALLLLLPPVTVVLGWTYRTNDQKVSAIGSYIRTELAPRLEAKTGERLLGWEFVHRADRGRRARKLGQLLVDLTLYGAVPVAALAIFWASDTTAPALVALAVAESLAVALLAGSIAAAADLHSDYRSTAFTGVTGA